MGKATTSSINTTGIFVSGNPTSNSNVDTFFSFVYFSSPIAIAREATITNGDIMLKRPHCFKVWPPADPLHRK